MCQLAVSPATVIQEVTKQLHNNQGKNKEQILQSLSFKKVFTSLSVT